MVDERRAAALDSLLGLAVGDALGSQFFVPGNGRELVAARLAPPPPWTWTDDTEMACSVFAVLDRHGHVDQDALAASFAEHYDFYRGYGPAMNRLLREIGDGASWRVAAPALFDGAGSFGNGAAMRVAPLGAWFGGDLAQAADQAARSAEVTHAHPDALAGAIAVAVAAAWPAHEPATLVDAVLDHTPTGLVRHGIERGRGLLAHPDVSRAAWELGNGSKVSAADTVPFVIWAAATHLSDYRAGIWTCIEAGGDVDTTCAMVGGILAGRLGAPAIPDQWRAATEPLPSWLEASR